eukprot:gene24634-biopygen10141
MLYQADRVRVLAMRASNHRIHMWREAEGTAPCTAAPVLTQAAGVLQGWLTRTTAARPHMIPTRHPTSLNH